MITKHFEVGDNDWGVLVCYNYSIRDWDDIYAISRSFGMSDSKAREAIKVLSGYNTGMTISNDGLRMSVMFISEATSHEEWYNTLTHELSHVATAIVDYYGKPCDGEEVAYLQGNLFKRIMREINA